MDSVETNTCMYRVPTDQGVMNEDGFNYSHNIFLGFPLHRVKGVGVPSGKHGIWILSQNTGSFMCLSPKFPDSKDQGYCAICSKIFIQKQKLGKRNLKI